VANCFSICAYICLSLRCFIEIAPDGHIASHIPQPVHRLTSTSATSGSISTSPCISGIEALIAAPTACATLSGISFGDWQQPATKMPSVNVSRGRSFGCASMKKQSFLLSPLHSFQFDKKFQIFANFIQTIVNYLNTFGN